MPLWETNGDSITAFVDTDTPLVIRYYCEDPPDNYEVVGHSIMEAIEQKLAWLLNETGDNPASVLAAARANFDRRNSRTHHQPRTMGTKEFQHARFRWGRPQGLGRGRLPQRLEDHGFKLFLDHDAT